MSAITILDLAIHLGAKEVQGSITAEEIERVGLPFMGGCYCCGATIAAYNACPSKNGYLKCLNGCIDDTGYATVEEAKADLFDKEDPEEEHLVGDRL